MLYLNYVVKKQKAGEGYDCFGTIRRKNPCKSSLTESTARTILAFIPIIFVGVLNKVFTTLIPKWYPNGFDLFNNWNKVWKHLDLPSFWNLVR